MLVVLADEYDYVAYADEVDDDNDDDDDDDKVDDDNE